MQKEAKPQKQQLLRGVSANFFGEAASMHIFFRRGRLTKVCIQEGWTDKKQNIPDLPKTGGRVYFDLEYNPITPFGGPGIVVKCDESKFNHKAKVSNIFVKK